MSFQNGTELGDVRRLDLLLMSLEIVVFYILLLTPYTLTLLDFLPVGGERMNADKFVGGLKSGEG